VTIAYSAATEACTFLLDEDGVCRRVLMAPDRRADATLGGRTREQAAKRCIGAQYVASIDVRVDGALVPMPRVGAPMLFAYTGEDGRLAVVRTGKLLRFETVAIPAAPRSSRDSIPIDWADEDDDLHTIPLKQSGERRTPRVSLLPYYPADDTTRDGLPAPSESAPTLKMVYARSDPAAARRTLTVPRPGGGAAGGQAGPASPRGGRGMLPRRAGRA
jgi:hypothetical protein